MHRPRTRTKRGDEITAPALDLDGKRRKDGSYAVETLRSELAASVGIDPLRKAAAPLTDDQRRLAAAFDRRSNPRTEGEARADWDGMTDVVGEPSQKATGHGMKAQLGSGPTPELEEKSPEASLYGRRCRKLPQSRGTSTA